MAELVKVIGFDESKLREEELGLYNRSMKVRDIEVIDELKKSVTELTDIKNALIASANQPPSFLGSQYNLGDELELPVSNDGVFLQPIECESYIESRIILRNNTGSSAVVSVGLSVEPAGDDSWFLYKKYTLDDQEIVSEIINLVGMQRIGLINLPGDNAGLITITGSVVSQV